MAWTGLAYSTSNFAPIWCDISAKFLVGASASISSVSLCINFRLWFIATDRVRILELGLGVPILEMVFHRRFDIYEGFGCRPASDNVLLTYLLILAPQLLLGIVSIIFSVMTSLPITACTNICLTHNGRPCFHHHTTLSVSFLWFLTLGGLATVCGIAYTVFVVYLNGTATSSPFTDTFTLWQSWDQMHVNITSVNTYAEEEWREFMTTELLLEANRWLFVGLGLIFFLFFGFTSEARRRYKLFFRWTLDREDDRGIVHYAVRDTESGIGSMTTLNSTSTEAIKALISDPRPIDVMVSTPLPEDRFTLHNPYPVHISDKNTQSPSVNLFPQSTEMKDDSVFTLPMFRMSELSMQLLPPPPLSSTSSSFSREPSPFSVPVVSNSGSVNSAYSQTTAWDSVYSSSPLIPAPSSPRIQPRASNANTNDQPTIAPGIGMQNAPSSPSLVTLRGRGRSNSGSSNSNYGKPSRARSLSRNRSASTTAPPTGPLPEIPSEVPSTPRNIGDLQLPSGNRQSSGTLMTPPTVSVPLAVDFAAPTSNILLQRGRTRSRSQSKERHLAAVEYGGAF
ncbi:hypothetical protein BT96DRAFT_913947 [Gymnopus androsaceus JB14]|uniref:STE3-domain-containing protein n=1 Tax=Gymnopus androsaceus JB14 TaxID=1447944 RepID=A0A6A4ICQ2_9AGAR|nr:hypothetical protein BT96DRAFT_913947 [Gymnopus androsaceus JB14]